jgi:antitoxin CcdA
MADDNHHVRWPFRSVTRKACIGKGLIPRTKRAVNLLVDAKMLAAAKAHRINFSQTLEDALRWLTQQARERKWADANREALEFHNCFSAEDGLWGEKYRVCGKAK